MSGAKPRGDFSLKKCELCNKLFTEDQQNWMQCPQAPLNIDARGRINSKHSEDQNFKLNLFIQFMRKLGISWHEIYWKVWACLQSLKCDWCKNKFPGNDLRKCSFHPEQPVFEEYDNYAK